MSAGLGECPQATLRPRLPRRALPRRPRSLGPQWREAERGPTPKIGSSLLLVIAAVAFLIGGHAAIDPLLQSAIAAREAKDIGKLAYTTPEGVFRRAPSVPTSAAIIGKVVACCERLMAAGALSAAPDWAKEAD